ncbi:MAG: S-methyl-5-thioribose-1-phosphate isomerase [Candidatus Acetothermia bacterium]|jgi:methylthioribose-1-phosphate isomerase|nr:S-methyl-5-thioribose-1-phosphate isomerase [Candidatus Acetothermia bacterium]MDH7505422.1 S-methyl-5-thioribose-1-phosphate isomerase [Candidatus Acetothermia bacterium]
MITPISYRDGAVELLDQTRLPQEAVVLKIREFRELARAIRELKVRGAPAIGLAAAYGVVLGLQNLELEDEAQLDRRFQEVVEELKRTRPTAVNLFWALERMARAFKESRAKGLGLAELKRALLAEAEAIHREDIEANKRIGRLGAELLPEGATVLTHCNAGALATGGYGTALGVVRSAWEMGRLRKVLVSETRPLLQGARLTAWELEQEGIPYELITDGMAGWLMARGEVGAVVVGADRIARNGDTANKIGTYSLAVLAHHHKIPFYVAAPSSTLDPACPTGREIPLEERSPEEVTTIRGVRLAPAGASARNPAFDVTPHEMISAIITERGVLRPPLAEAIADVLP